KPFRCALDGMRHGVLWPCLDDLRVGRLGGGGVALGFLSLSEHEPRSLNEHDAVEDRARRHHTLKVRRRVVPATRERVDLAQRKIDGEWPATRVGDGLVTRGIFQCKSGFLP